MDAVLFASLLWQVIDFLRELANMSTQRSAVITQATAWIGGIVLVALAAHAQVATGLVLPGTDIALGNLDLGSTILVGLLVSSLGSTGVDLKQAFDHSDSAAKPPLVPPPAPPTP